MDATTTTTEAEAPDLGELADLVDGEAEAEESHTWARSTRGLPAVTGCGIVGPILPNGHRARRGVAYRPTCGTCSHLGACTAEECETCAGAAEARAVALADLVTLARSAVATVAQVAPADAPAVAEAPAPAGLGDAVAEGNGYRVPALADTVGPRALLRSVRRVLNRDKYMIGAEFAVSMVGGKGEPRSLVIVPDGEAPAHWSPVLSRVRAALASAGAGEHTEAGQTQTRAAEPIPF